MKNSRFQIENNLIENSICSVALGRKNYLFGGFYNGARNAAIIYSFLATFKLNVIEPYGWLTNAQETMPDYPANKLSQLIPGLK